MMTLASGVAIPPFLFGLGLLLAGGMLAIVSTGWRFRPCMRTAAVFFLLAAFMFYQHRDEEFLHPFTLGSAIAGAGAMIASFVVPKRKQRAVAELLCILREARSLLARPENDFDMSRWKTQGETLADLDEKITNIENGQLPTKFSISVLAAPTGSMQEVSLSSGWPHEFFTFAEKLDEAIERAYSRRET